MPAAIPRFIPDQDDAYCNESNIAEVLGITGAFTIAAIITVGLRVYVRVSMLHFFGPDDCIMAIAALLAIGTFVCFVGETHYGIGRHAECIGPADLEMMLKWQFFHDLWNTTGVCLVKISIAFFLWRLAPEPAYKWFLGGCIVFLALFAVACACTLIFSCIPVAASWNFALRAHAKCFSVQTYTSIGLFNSIISIITDFLFALLPIPIIVKMRASRRTKATLGVILSLGLVACVAGVVKAQIQMTFLKIKDPYWHDGFMVWGLIEFCLGILAASLPVLRPLASVFLISTRSLLGRSKTSDQRTYPSTNRNSGYRRQESSGDVHGAYQQNVKLGVLESPQSTQHGKEEADVAVQSVPIDSEESLGLPLQTPR